MKYEDIAACSGCVRAVYAALDFDMADGDEEFDAGFGDMIDAMHDALAAIHRARRERFTTKHDDIANVWEAATKLVEVAAAIERTIERGRDLGTHLDAASE